MLVGMRKALFTVGFFIAPATLFAATPTAPSEVALLAQHGTRLIAFKSSGESNGSDAAAVIEKDGADGSKQRDLLILHKQEGRFTVVDHNEKIVACSVCGQLRDDPFDPAHLQVTPGHITLVQTHGGETASESNYSFYYDATSARWRVASAKRKDVTNQGDGPATYGNDPLPSSGLFRDFDGRWKVTSFWSGYVVNVNTHRFSEIVNKPNEASLDRAISESCTDASACHVLLRQENGCMALVKDSAQAFFAAGTREKHTESQALDMATTACKAKGNGDCEEQTSYCAIGFR